MSKMIENIKNKSVEQLRIQKKNAMRELDNPKATPENLRLAEAILDRIDEVLSARYLPGMIKTFSDVNPGGFYGEKQAIEERDFKMDAIALFRELLNKPVFYELLENKDFDELLVRTKKVVNATNFIQASFERPILFDAIKTELGAALFYPALYNCLYGEGTPEQRLGRFADVLIEMDLGKWTYASYFLFLAEPESCMFVKPDMLKRALEMSKYDLIYESTPSEQKYKEILEFSQWLKKQIRSLEPRDMVDVHSFIWYMAPTGIWKSEVES